MKIARLLAVSLLCSGGAVAFASDDSANDAASSGYEPGTVPASVTEPVKKGPTREDLARAKERREAAQQNNDWLVRGYEEQLQARELANGPAQSNNLYTELTSSQELARAAGLSSNAPAPAPDNLRTGTNAGAPRLSLRTDASAAPSGPTTRTDLSKTTGIQLKPLITPLESSEVAGLHDLFTQLPALSVDSATIQPSASDGALAAQDPGALDVPGMVAAESDPAKRADLDLTLDGRPAALPVDSPAVQEPSHHGLALELPSASNTDQLHKQQDSALLPPGMRKTVAPLPINPLLLKPAPADDAAMVPTPSPVRGQVDDPYDMLR